MFLLIISIGFGLREKNERMTLLLNIFVEIFQL